MHIEDFGPFTLSKGAHGSPSEGMCVMEMVSFLAGEIWSDRPKCSSPAIAIFAHVANDRMGQAGRDRLERYVPKLIGTVSPGHELERAEYLTWQAIRVFAPIALDARGFTEHAERLRNFQGSFSEAAKVCREAAEAAAAAAAAADAAAEAAEAVAAADAADAAPLWPVADAAAEAVAAAADAAEAAEAVAAAADAADASKAADAAEAATYATYATYAAAVAAVAWKAATRSAFEAACFETLDHLIEMGPHGEAYETVHIERALKLRELLAA